MTVTKGTCYKDVPDIKPTARTRAYEHALSIEFAVLARMAELNITKKELAERMGISPSGLSNLLNGQPNMTLETLAKFELALNFEFSLTIKPQAGFQSEIGSNVPTDKRAKKSSASNQLAYQENPKRKAVLLPQPPACSSRENAEHLLVR